MAWPYDTVTPVKQELMIGGAWTDMTTRTRGSDKSVIITRGYSSEQAALSSGSCNFWLRNWDGLFSNRNPTSDYYRLIGKNTRYRNSIGTGTTSLRLTDTSGSDGDYDGARAWTADKASLDITGDIDIRIDCEADDWRGRRGQILAAKYQPTSDQRSWALTTDPYGYLQFIWSTDGTTANRFTAYSSEKVTEYGRQAFRMTMDVNNGAAQHVTTFYTAATIAGPWVQLGSVQTDANTTGFFSSSANLEVGTAGDGTDRGLFGTGFNSDPFTGKVYSFELYTGIGGTLVAKMDATAKTAGTTSWSDGLTSPNTWALTGSAEITAQDYRFHGQVPEFPSEWDPTGRDVEANITAGDIVEQLSAGKKPLRSPIFRNLSQYTLDGYWPMEDDFGATMAGAFNGRPALLRSASFGTAEGLPGSAGALAFTDDDGYAYGLLDSAPAVNGVSFNLFYFKFASLPASGVMVMDFRFTGGTAARATITVSSTTYRIDVYDSVAGLLDSGNISFGTGAEPTQWIGMRVLMTESGGTVTWELAWYPVGAAVLYGSSGTFSGTVGRPFSFNCPQFTGKSDLQIAHVALAREDLGFNTTSFTESTNGYEGETAYTRAFRLAGEENVPFWWIGAESIDGAPKTQPMGVQGLKILVDLLQECAVTDGGQLYAPRDKLGLTIRSYYNLINRDGPVLDYTAKHLSGALLPREPAEVRNDVTISRVGGSSGRWVKSEGSFNINDPDDDPDGVGLYDVALSYSAGTDAQLVPLAQREVLIGTWDALRFARVQVQLHRAALLADPALSRALIALELGQMFSLTNLPLFGGGPDDVLELLRGYVETISNKTRSLDFNAVPYGPYITGIWTDPRRRWAAKWTTLGGSLTTTGTSVSFRSSEAEEYWSTTNLPYEVTVAGEVMNVTAMGAVSGSGPYFQTATVTRSVNGVVKTHAALEPIKLVQGARWAFDGGNS